MSKTFITHQVDGQAAVVNAKWRDIQAEAAKHRRSRIIVEGYSEEREWSDGQRKWFKGILLPALAQDTGDSKLYWENRLKLAVMPDEFQPLKTKINGKTYWYLPSITILSMTKMNDFIEGSVEKCHEWGFLWVTLPDKELRKL